MTKKGSEREIEPRPAVQFDGVSPQFTVPDVVRTAEYYRDVLNFTIAGYWGDPPVFCIVWRGEVQFFFNQADARTPRTERAEGAYDAFVRVRGVDLLAEQLRQDGADILEGPAQRVYHQRELVIRDCNGLIIAFGEATNGTSETVI
jgi:hypothetical protein